MTQNSRRYRAQGAPPDPVTLKDQIKVLEDLIESRAAMVECLLVEVKLRKKWLVSDRRRLEKMRRQMDVKSP